MMSRGTQIILSLNPRGLRGAVVKNGHVVQAESFAFDDPALWADSWEDGLRPYDQTLRQLVSRLCNKKTIRRTTLVYQSPSAVVQYDEMSGSKQTAEDRAESRIREMVGLSGSVRTRVVAQGVKDGEEMNSCLTVADQDATMLKLYAWMSRCGLRAEQMIPASGIMMAQAIESSLRQSDDCAVCYMGEDSSVIAYSKDGQVMLVRSIEIGYRHLSDVYRSVFGAESNSENQSSEMTDYLIGKDGPEALVWRYGVPLTASNDEQRVLRKEVLPRIAPILQRYSVEVKQTFRFGLRASEMPARLVMCGPGASIPHIGAALSQNCDMHIDLVNGSEVYTPTKPFGIGTLEGQYAENSGAIPSILPKIARESNQRRSCDRAIAAGIVLAIGVMAFEVGSVHMKANAMKNKIEQNESVVHAIEEERDVRKDTVSHAAAVGEIVSVFTANYGRQPDWSSSFEGLSNSMKKSIQIEQIHGNNADRDISIGLTGLAIGEEGADPTAILNEFVLTLRAQEGILDVRLGATSKRTTSSGKPAVHFELTMPIRSDEAPFHEYMAYATETSEKETP